MKKHFRRDFRRETQEIISLSGKNDAEISVILQTTPRTVARWRSGESSPQPVQFERVKQLIGGWANVPAIPHPPSDAHSREWLDGKFDQLTKQIALLQGENAVIQKRLDALEASEKKRDRTRRDGVGEKSNR